MGRKLGVEIQSAIRGFGSRSLVAASASSVPEETEQIGETNLSVSMDPSVEARVSDGAQLGVQVFWPVVPGVFSLSGQEMSLLP